MSDAVFISEFWKEHEEVAGDYKQLLRHISSMSTAASKKFRSIAWRGQADAEWPLTSNLYRVFNDSKSNNIEESDFAKFEKKVLVELRQWGLHLQDSGGRLSVLSQLAMLQHFGTPTRLIDISFNALVAAFFAVEHNKHEKKDGRLFAIDITDRQINESRVLRKWEDSLDTPWSDSYKEQQLQIAWNSSEWTKSKSHATAANYLTNWEREWCSHYFVWKPPSLNARIAAQNGGFLFGGIVGSSRSEGFVDHTEKRIENKSFQIANPNIKTKCLSIDEVKKLTCLAIRPQRFPKHAVHERTKNAVYSIRIAADAKKEIRKQLEDICGYSHATIFPDFPGFAEYRIEGR